MQESGTAVSPLWPPFIAKGIELVKEMVLALKEHEAVRTFIQFVAGVK